MANRTIKIYGNNHGADTALTVSWAGAQVFNGTTSASVVDYADVYGGDTTSPEELFEFTYNNADDTKETEHALSITCTAGSCTVGAVFVISNNDNTNYDSYPATYNSKDGKPPVTDIGGKWYWNPGVNGIYQTVADPIDDSLSERKDIQVNSATPLTEGYTGSSGGVMTYNGMAFYLGTDDVFTCTARVPKILVANPNSGKPWGWT